MKTRLQASFGAACLAALTVLVLSVTPATTETRQGCESRCMNENARCMSARRGQDVGMGLQGRAWDRSGQEAKAACGRAQDACLKAC
jgi:hypothetical protein